MFLWFLPTVDAMMIHEVLYDPSGTDTGLERIVLFNEQSAPISLGGWELTAMSKHFAMPSVTLDAGSRITVHWREDGADSTADIYTGSASINENIGNTAASVALFNAPEHNKDTIVDFVQYGEASQTWESTASAAGIWTRGSFVTDAPEGSSIVRSTAGLDTNTPDDWVARLVQTPAPSTTPAPTPTPTPSPSPSPTPSLSPDASPSTTAAPSPTPVATPSPTPEVTQTSLPQAPTPTPSSLPTPTPTPVALPVIHINEFLPNTSGTDSEEEWIEIWNMDANDADISRWSLDDADGGSSPYIFPDATHIAPNAYATFARPMTGIALNNDVDAVRLLTPAGQLYEHITYEKPPKGASSNRTAAGSFSWSWTPTPGAANTIAADHATPAPSQENRDAGNHAESTPSAKSDAVSEDMRSSEPSILPRIAETVYAPKTRDPFMDDTTVTRFPRVSDAHTLYTADAVTAAQRNGSFFTRNALSLIIFAALIGAIGIVRWRKARKFSVEMNS